MRLTRRTIMLALAVVLAADAVLQWSTPSSVLLQGALDESANVGTALVALAALWRDPPPQAVLATAVAGVIIDLDHVPALIAGEEIISAGTPRPITHSLVVPAVTGGAAAVTRNRWMIGATIGLTAHLVRDIGTAGGIPGLWPLSRMTIEAPHWTYLLILAAMAVAALVRAPETDTARRGG